jgi:hypothetical protein
VGSTYRSLVTLSVLLFVGGSAGGQSPGDSTSRWSVDFRYGNAAFAGPSATLPLIRFEPGRYVELSFLPTGAPEYGVAYALSRDASVLLLAEIAFQTNLTTLDVSDSSFRSFQQGEYPVATLRVSQIRGVFHLRANTDLPLNLGRGMWRAGLGITYVWGSSVNLLDQARTFPGIQSINSHGNWLLAMDVGVGYLIPGSSVTVTASASFNLHMEFVSNYDFLEIAMGPSSPYRFKSSDISPVYLSLGVIVDL